MKPIKTTNLSNFGMFMHVAAHGSLTYSLRTRRVITAGYAVRPYQSRQLVLTAPLRVHHLSAYMAREADLLRQPAHCLWVRFSPTDGRTYLDVAIAVADSTQARGVARACGAKEYYDLSRQSPESPRLSRQVAYYDMAREPGAITTRTERDTEQFLAAV
jgi:hypothetical protein